jgi:carbonic anhydrase
MKTLASLFENNRKWASRISQADPTFFSRLTQQQSPGFLWIGCSDSRVPANEIVGLLPGELFVHRNIANLVIHTDMNCLSVLQYAVDVLKIRDIIVCGHYGCGGVKTVFEKQPHGLIDNWLRPVWNLRQEYAAELTEFATLDEQVNRLCEMNVIEQVKQVAHTTVIQEAWQRNQPVRIHGWIYAISDGLLQDLGAFVSSEAELSTLERQQ